MGREALQRIDGGVPVVRPVRVAHTLWRKRRTGRLADTPELERPRERMQSRGPTVLTDAELLALLVGSGTRGRDALAIAADVQARLAAAPGVTPRVADLAAIAGVGPVRACAIAASLELGRRLATRPEDDPPAINAPSDVFIL